MNSCAIARCASSFCRIIMHEPAHPRPRIEVLLLLNAAQWRCPPLLRKPKCTQFAVADAGFGLAFCATCVLKPHVKLLSLINIFQVIVHRNNYFSSIIVPSMVWYSPTNNPVIRGADMRGTRKCRLHHRLSIVKHSLMGRNKREELMFDMGTTVWLIEPLSGSH